MEKSGEWFGPKIILISDENRAWFHTKILFSLCRPNRHIFLSGRGLNLSLSKFFSFSQGSLFANPILSPVPAQYPRKYSLLLSSYFLWRLLLSNNPVIVPIKEKNRMIAGISWRRTIIAPIIMKIHKATPASFKLIPLANAGVAVKLIKLTIRAETNFFFPFGIPHSPFLFGFALWSAFHMPTVKLNLGFLQCIEILRFSKV